MAHSGRCLCGAITYEFPDDPAVWAVCHCLNCQRQAGSAFSTLAGVPMAKFNMTGEPKLYEDHDTDSGNSVQRYFCGECGSPIYSALAEQPDVIYLKTGTLDDTSAFNPAFHVWTSTKQQWVDLPEGVPQLARQSE